MISENLLSLDDVESRYSNLHAFKKTGSLRGRHVSGPTPFSNAKDQKTSNYFHSTTHSRNHLEHGRSVFDGRAPGLERLTHIKFEHLSSYKTHFDKRGFWKRLWKKHKVAVIIVGIVIVLTVAVVVSTVAIGSAAGAAAAGGGAALDNANDSASSNSQKKSNTNREKSKASDTLPEETKAKQPPIPRVIIDPQEAEEFAEKALNDFYQEVQTNITEAVAEAWETAKEGLSKATETVVGAWQTTKEGLSKATEVVATALRQTPETLAMDRAFEAAEKQASEERYPYLVYSQELIGELQEKAHELVDKGSQAIYDVAKSSFEVAENFAEIARDVRECASPNPLDKVVGGLSFIHDSIGLAQTTPQLIKNIEDGLERIKKSLHDHTDVAAVVHQMEEANKQASLMQAEQEGYRPCLKFAPENSGLGATQLIDQNNPNPNNRITTYLP